MFRTKHIVLGVFFFFIFGVNSICIAESEESNECSKLFIRQVLEEAIQISKNNDIVLIFAGLTENYESEGIDRTSLDIPDNQNKPKDS